MHEQRATVGACADETITTLSNLVDKFRHLQNAPWWPLPRGRGTKEISPEKVSPTKLQEKRKSKAKNMANSFFKDAADDASDSYHSETSRSSRAASATPSRRSQTASKYLRTFPGKGERKEVFSSASMTLPARKTRNGSAQLMFDITSDDNLPLMEQAQGLVSELQRSFDMLHDSAADDVEYYKEIFRLVDDLDQDLDESLQ